MEKQRPTSLNVYSFHVQRRETIFKQDGRDDCEFQESSLLLVRLLKGRRRTIVLLWVCCGFCRPVVSTWHSLTWTRRAHTNEKWNLLVNRSNTWLGFFFFPLCSYIWWRVYFIFPHDFGFLRRLFCSPLSILFQVVFTSPSVAFVLMSVVKNCSSQSLLLLLLLCLSISPHFLKNKNKLVATDQGMVWKLHVSSGFADVWLKKKTL